ncbi:hypothetical protein [Mobilicoccus sp.]|uniref:hypothetical protein n=1 Tax=Mobilicoccus sp. TaxID=2034349 RepID=UPI00289711BA|nr:hypothetical protein [Mobilicoccus sp.]
MSEIPGPRDAHGRPQDHVPGRDGVRGGDAWGPGHLGPDGGFGGPTGPGWEGGAPRRGGFSPLPFPRYSTTTRNGTVVVGGCCLPIPLGCLTLAVSAAGYATYRALRTG